LVANPPPPPLAADAMRNQGTRQMEQDAVVVRQAK
jgi:hypothetical protein